MIIKQFTDKDIQLLKTNPKLFWEQNPKLGDYAFENVTENIDIDLPDKCTISYLTFHNANTIKNIKYNPFNQTQLLNDKHFKNMKNLQKITVPLGTKYNDMFYDINSLPQIDYQKTYTENDYALDDTGLLKLNVRFDSVAGQEILHDQQIIDKTMVLVVDKDQSSLSYVPNEYKNLYVQYDLDKEFQYRLLLNLAHLKDKQTITLDFDYNQIHIDECMLEKMKSLYLRNNLQITNNYELDDINQELFVLENCYCGSPISRDLLEHRLNVSIDKNCINLLSLDKLQNFISKTNQNGYAIHFSIGQGKMSNEFYDKNEYVYNKKDIQKIIQMNNLIVNSGNPEIVFNECNINNVQTENLYKLKSGYKNNDWKLSQVIEANAKLDQIVNQIKSCNMSPYEKMIYIHNFVTANFRYKKDDDNSYIDKSRTMISGLATSEQDYSFVCTGYASMIKTIIDKLDDKNLQCKIGSSSVIVNNKDKDKLDYNGHSFNFIKIRDQKYGINGIYYNDATWDNSDTNSQMAHMLMPLEQINCFKNKLNLVEVKNLGEHKYLRDATTHKNLMDKYEKYLNTQHIDKQDVNDLYLRKLAKEHNDEKLKLFLGEDYKSPTISNDALLQARTTVTTKLLYGNNAQFDNINDDQRVNVMTDVFYDVLCTYTNAKYYFTQDAKTDKFYYASLIDYANYLDNQNPEYKDLIDKLLTKQSNNEQSKSVTAITKQYSNMSNQINNNIQSIIEDKEISQ